MGRNVLSATLPSRVLVMARRPPNACSSTGPGATFARAPSTLSSTEPGARKRPADVELLVEEVGRQLGLVEQVNEQSASRRIARDGPVGAGVARVGADGCGLVVEVDVMCRSIAVACNERAQTELERGHLRRVARAGVGVDDVSPAEQVDARLGVHRHLRRRGGLHVEHVDEPASVCASAMTLQRGQGSFGGERHRVHVREHHVHPTART